LRGESAGFSNIYFISGISADGEGYRELEKVTQKYEGEIRNHIRVKTKKAREFKKIFD